MEDNQGNGQGATRSRWHKLGCWIWFRIFVLALVAILLVAYSVEVFRCGYYKPTGDALYDRYAKAVISRQKWLLFHGGKHHPTYLPDSLLAEWESEFGSDPRYWQLRYFCARHKGFIKKWMANYPPVAGTPNFLWVRPWDSESSEMENSAWEHLQAGVDHDAADWMTLWILERESIGFTGAANFAEMEAIDNLEIDELEKRQRKIELSREQEQAELARLTVIVDSDPSQAWPYYWRSKYWFMYGESKLALVDIKAGNAAPNNEILRSFPVNFLLERMEKGDHLGSGILAGAIFEEGSSIVRTNWIEWKNVYYEAKGMVALGGDTEIIHELHIAACRLGTAKYNDSWEPMVASVFEWVLSRDMLVQYGQDLTYRQRLAMMGMYERAQDVQDNWRMRSAGARQHLRNYPRLLAIETENNSSVSGLGNSVILPPNVDFFQPEKIWQHLKPRLYYNRALWLQQQQHAGVIGIRDSFKQLEYVNLNTLEWPQEWGNPY